MVTANRRPEVVEPRSTVEVKSKEKWSVMVKRVEHQAVRRPPREPSARVTW